MAGFLHDQGGKMDVNGKVETVRTACAAGLACFWGYSMVELNHLISIVSGLTLVLYTVCQTIIITPKVIATVYGWWSGLADWFRARKA